ncbi:MAG: hypothetical protein AAF789_00150 [Bacteroidota bacterium]
MGFGICVFALTVGQLTVQGQDSVKVKFDFENNSSEWTGEHGDTWKISSEQSFSGQSSLQFLVSSTEQLPESSPALYSIETGHTIMQVRTMQYQGQTLIVGTSYEGTVVCFTYGGIKVWENKLSGFMNHDINCADIDGDGNDEVLAANADGSIYAIDDNGQDLWSFRSNQAPMFTVCAVQGASQQFIACGGFDKHLYYLSPEGQEIKKIHSTEYSVDRQGGGSDHAMNFMRRITQNGEDVLVVHSLLNTNWAQGTLYFFEPGASEPYSNIPITANPSHVYGTFGVNDIVTDSTEILLGANFLTDLKIASATVESGLNRALDTKSVRQDYLPTGYRMASVEVIPEGNSFNYLTLVGNRILLTSPDPSVPKAEVLKTSYAYNGIFKDTPNDKILLASAQSGGSCIHVIDYNNPEWKAAYENLVPPGKISEIVKNNEEFARLLDSFTQPEWERDQKRVYVMAGGASDELKAELNAINSVCPSFTIDAGIHPIVEDWDRSGLQNQEYRDRRDERKKYEYTSQQCIDQFTSSLDETSVGLNMWSGHGSDPMYYSLETMKTMADISGSKVMLPVFAELETYDTDFEWLMDFYMYPLADHLKTRNGLISLRNKHLFWQNIVYTPAWERLVSGEFSEVFVSSMEESNSKTMDMSVSGRMGLWASGAMDRWGTRFTRDNPCYDRARQISYQRLTTHSFRMFVYHLANGASVIHNHNVDEEFTRLLWYMLAKGILFVPEREEIISFNPVHMSMLEPDPYFLDQDVKDVTTFDVEFEQQNPMIVGQKNGPWPGAPVNEWDFSHFASGANERRLEFIPPYPHGMVLTTPPDDPSSPRGVITDHLHPIYDDIVEEVFWDGRNYYSDINKSNPKGAVEYGSEIANRIKSAAEKLPLSVEGRVGWVAAHSAPNHIRLSLIDGGYVNPDKRNVKVTFNTVNVKKIINLINGESIPVVNKEAMVKVPVGLFTFLDIELEQDL